MTTLMTHLAGIVLAAENAAPQAGGPVGELVNSNWAQLLPFLLIFGILYVMMIRPANKQRRQHQEMLSALKKGDEVVTTGGMYGRIVSIEERELHLEIADRVKIRILRDRIEGRWNPNAAVAGGRGTVAATTATAAK